MELRGYCWAVNHNNSLDVKSRGGASLFSLYRTTRFGCFLKLCSSASVGHRNSKLAILYVPELSTWLYARWWGPKSQIPLLLHSEISIKIVRWKVIAGQRRRVNERGVQFHPVEESGDGRKVEPKVILARFLSRDTPSRHLMSSRPSLVLGSWAPLCFVFW